MSEKYSPNVERLWLLLKVLFVIILLRVITIFMGFDRHIPVLDDIIRQIILSFQSISNSVAKFLGFSRAF